jgi:hypothetical protein
MGNKTLEELASDPFLATLAGKPAFTRVSPDIAAGLLYISRAALDDMYARKQIPPAWGETNGKRYYSLGEIQRYVEAEEGKTRERIEKETGASATAPKDALPTTPKVDSSLSGPLNARDLAAAGLGEPLLRGGRRKGIKHASFASFLSTGTAMDEWLFAMLPPERPGMAHARPVDLIAALDMNDELLIEAGFAQLTLRDYTIHLRDFLDQETALEREQEALGEGPSRPGSRQRPRA